MIQSADINDVTVVHFTDRKLLDVEAIKATFDFLARMVEERGRRRLVLDLGKVEQFSSFALGKLLVLLKKVEAAGGRMVLCHVSPHIRMIFASPSRPLFDVYDDEPA